MTAERLKDKDERDGLRPTEDRGWRHALRGWRLEVGGKAKGEGRWTRRKEVGIGNAESK